MISFCCFWVFLRTAENVTTARADVSRRPAQRLAQMAPWRPTSSSHTTPRRPDDTGGGDSHVGPPNVFFANECGLPRFRRSLSFALARNASHERMRAANRLLSLFFFLRRQTFLRAIEPTLREPTEKST